MPTIAFVSPKGGAGKTTSAFLLSTALAKLYDVTSSTPIPIIRSRPGRMAATRRRA
jgi:Mrp family chromosome partitioning ATPase